MTDENSSWGWWWFFDKYTAFMKKYTTYSIKSRCRVQVRKTLIESVLERELRQRDSLLGTGVIETFFGPFIYLRRATRPNKLKHNLIYLRRVERITLDIDSRLMETGYGKEGKLEYLCVGKLNPKEIYSNVEFEDLGNGDYKVRFDPYRGRIDLYRARERRKITSGLLDGITAKCRETPGEMKEGRYGTFKITNPDDLIAIVGEFCEGFLKADYTVSDAEDGVKK